MLYMPFQTNKSVFVDLLVSTITTILFPLSLSLLLPVFLYLVVLEKEEKLIQMMRMNGMKMRNYWLVNFVFNLGISLLTNAAFYLYGIFFLDLPIFNKTGSAVFLTVLLGWILCQIGMATFFQVFIQSSRAANIIGYLISIWTNLIGATFNLALYQYPRAMPIGILLYPTFSFNRLFYNMFNACSNDSCYKHFSNFSEEDKTCLIIIYCSFVFFQLLGMYLHEVVPQQYGTRQSLNFPIKALIKRIKGSEVSRKSHQVFYSNSLETAYDEEAKKEKERVAEIADFSE